MSHEENQAVWRKFSTIPQQAQDIITDEQTSKSLMNLQEKLQLSDELIGMISFHVRKLFFNELTLAEAEKNLIQVFERSGDDPNKVDVVIQYIQNEIFTIKPQPRVEETEEEMRPKGEVVRMPLLQALSKYEQLGNQLITRERIKIKSQPEPVRPSLLYWIKYYRDELGIGHHSSVQRGDFLFRSENGKRLSPEERERVNLVLKSVEENMPLDIDTERSEILFPIFTTPERPVAQRMEPPMAPTLPPEKMQPRINPAFQFGQDSRGTNAPVAPTPAGEMSFTSKHVFPAEREAATPEMTPTTVPARAPVPGAQTIPRPNPFRIRPVSLGKHEE